MAKVAKVASSACAPFALLSPLRAIVVSANRCSGLGARAQGAPGPWRPGEHERWLGKTRATDARLWRGVRRSAVGAVAIPLEACNNFSL